jgi:2',3'-cyclic-nucleotide 2'-phosphodiesterase (5'-nucleotidase family)/predicted AlkP superfamily phosphohydrolase/phosphomutase
MTGRFRRLLRLSVGLTTVGVMVTLGAGAAGAEKKDDARPVEKVVLFASDGMRPDLVEKYAKAGAMPTYRRLMKDGVVGKNGMLQAFPPNTGVGWYTMATGAYPSEHGSTNNTFHRTGDTFSNRTSFSAAPVLQADTIANAAERAGKKVAQIDWVAGAAANIAGPTVDFASFFSNRGVLVGALNTVEQAGAAFFGTNYEVASVTAAAGWSGVPTGDPAAPPKQTTWAINSTSAALNPNRVYNVYFYDSVTGGGVKYDHAIVSPVGKTGASPSVDLKVGDFKAVRLTGLNGLTGTRAGQTVGHYVKLISLSSDGSQFKLYDTSLARAIAKCGAPCAGLPAGGATEDRLEKYIADNLPPWSAGDFSPLEAGVIDEDTYVQQGRDLERVYSLAVINFILGTLQPDTDLAMVGYPFTDEVSHQFMALVSPTDADGAPNPCFDVNPKFDDVQCTGRGTAGRVAIREGYIRSAYADADEKLGLARKLMGGKPTTFAASDHGFAPAWYAVNANKVLNAATVGGASLHVSGAGASNCSAIAATPVTAANTDLTKACWAGGTIQIYINPDRLRSTANPTFPTYEETRTAIRAAFQNLTDPANPGKQVIQKIMNKEELRNVDGSDSLHPNRSGDVVVVTRPPYQSDAGTPDKAVALSHFFGQHGYMPDMVDLKNNINMHATFVAGGPGIEEEDNARGLRAVDIAPTIAFLMDIPGPQNARGRILYDILEDADDLTEVTILDISDYHGQLIPLTEASDTVGPAFSIGGSAFLKKWFEIYEAEAALSGGRNPAVIEMAAGDSVGATPPISNAFGDVPTIEVMNMMGIDIDGLGNHNFDRGSDYLRNTLIPLAKYPFVSANVLDAAGKTPAEWSKSHVFTFRHGLKIGFVGFTNEDAPTLTKPGSFDPFVTPLGNATAAVNAEAAQLARKTDAIIAIGHHGATGGTLTAPTGPLVDLADNVSNVDAVIGDHTDQQVLTTRSNGVLVTENRSKGLRFTRVRLVFDDDDLVYKTADFHKPWTIGLTPDAPIQAKIDDLNAQLLPILGTQVGDSNVAVPRSDACAGTPPAGTGRTDGRACESLVGDVVTDAMRQQYGTDFAITNSGGLRDNLTCPTTDSATDFCPPSLYPFAAGHFPITRGQVLAVLPFGNQSATATVNGVTLKEFLETAVAPPPTTGTGRFGQVSGLCVEYNIEATAKQFDASGTGLLGTGSRVSRVVRQASDGTCDFTAGTPVVLDAGHSYTLTINDFMMTGGDGYPNVRTSAATQDLLDQDVADYLATLPGSQVTPTIQHRVHCFDPNPGSGNNCPPNSP